MVSGGNRYTFVFVLHTDGNFYLISAAGIIPVSDSTVSSLTVDRFQVNRLAGTGANTKYRRWGTKLPETVNPLLEAQQLYEQLAVMT